MQLGSTPPPLRRTTLLLAAGAAIVAVTAGPASAHVRVSSPDAAPGGFGKLVFRVPNESAKATTTKVSVTLPGATPFAFVSSRPAPGWTVATTTRKLDRPLKVEGFTLTKVVSTVTWTARPGSGLAPGQFDEFELSVGPFPKKAGALLLPATQTYSDGEVVNWDQPTPKSGQEPEHPAPTLELGTTAAATTHPADESDDTARWLGGGGLALGAAALGVSLFSRRRLPAQAPA